MRKQLLTLCLCGLAATATLRAQSPDSAATPPRKYAPRHSILIGTGTSGAVGSTNPRVTGQRETLRIVNFQPRLGFFLTEGLALGLEGRIGGGWGTLVDDYRYFGLGGFARYYPLTRGRTTLLAGEGMPIMGKWMVVRKINEPTRRFIADHLFPFLELGAGTSNFRQSGAAYIVLDRLEEPWLTAAVGADLRVWKVFFVELALMQSYFPNNAVAPWQGPRPRLGIECIIPTHRQR